MVKKSVNDRLFDINKAFNNKSIEDSNLFAKKVEEVNLWDLLKGPKKSKPKTIEEQISIFQQEKESLEFLNPKENGNILDRKI